MELATALSVVQTILTTIQTLDQLKATFSFTKFKDEFERLEKTVSIVQSVLEDADAKQGVLSHQQKIYIQELKDAIFDADDVLDDFITLVKQKRAKAQTETHNYLSNKVRSFLSRFSLRIHNLSSKVKDVNTKLDEIASNNKFLFKVDNQPTRFIKPESSSFVSENDRIIGRDEELEKVVKMLLNSDDADRPNNLTSLAIVGMGGLGKTAFAQLVYNDPRISSAFQLKSWTCVADQDRWNLTDLLGKIVKELPKRNTRDTTTLEQIHVEIRKRLGGKKYLLVLDDVWNENYHSWLDLENILSVGATGSRIVVTTRSKKTAQIVGNDRVHELQGLLEEESWCLFERMAFLPKQLENLDDELVRLGKEIVKKCANVPLAIRVVGSLLRGEPKLKWLSFRDKELANITESDDTMNNILRLSYHQLNFSLKSCFSYCAIFPKDFVIDRQMLISLWMAQGYISAEYVGEEYFLILLQRCFFQDLKVDEWGEIREFKIHDLLHDIAEQVVGKDISRMSSVALSVGNRVHHLSLLYGFCPQETFDKSHIRTCVQVREQWGHSSSEKLLAGNTLANWTCLRSLDLRDLCAENIPESIGELFHLRYLNLSQSKMLNALPVSITKLVNLQTLDLSNCTSLQELPKDVSNLLDLSTLNVTDCRKLSHMPPNMGLLTHLHTLGLFVVARENSEGKRAFSGLEDLRTISNLKGFLEIRIWGFPWLEDYVREDHNKGGYLRDKERLKKIHIEFIDEQRRTYKTVHFKQAAAFLEQMQPHHDLKELRLDGYIGKILPKWLRREDNSTLVHLPNLVSLHISNCLFIQCLTSPGELPHLKYLTVEKLPNVEYMVNVQPEEPGVGEGSTLFPRLERLVINDLSKLKGWWPGLCPGVPKKHLIVSKPAPYFAQLRELRISNCPMLTSIPVCSPLKSVSILNCPEATVFEDITQKISKFFQMSIPSDSKSRIISIGEFEYNMESNTTDTELTTRLHRWMSTRGYTSKGERGRD